MRERGDHQGDSEGADRTAGAMPAKEPMMKRAPPKKKPAHAYHEILHSQAGKNLTYTVQAAAQRGTLSPCLLGTS
jgi:hypothetical protein